MATCKECKNSFGFMELKNSLCKSCIKKNDQTFEAEHGHAVEQMLLTTEHNPNLKIEQRIEIISAECAYGMDLFKDFFTSISDVFGGRNKSTQSVLRDARKQVLKELKIEAARIGANAVIAVSLNYSEFSGKGKSMLFVVATGTAVKLSPA